MGVMGDAFYTEQGQIKDVGQAHEVANLVVDKGTRVAEAREMELKRQTETGLTDEERNNLAIMAGVKEKYPDAFDCIIDSKGREFSRIRESYIDTHGDSVKYFTQYGLLLTTGGGVGWLGDDEIVDKANEAARTQERDRGSVWQMIDLTSEKMQGVMKNILERTQEKESRAKEAIKSKVTSSLAENVLAKL